jgi:PAS domain S-box-containing protein
MDWVTFAERLADAQARLRSLRLHHPDIANFDGFPALDEAIADLGAAQEDLRAQMQQLVEVRRELTEQRRRYRMLFVSAPAAYLVTNLAGLVRDANQQAGALLNVRPKFLIGKPLVLYVAESQRHEFHDRLRLLQSPGSACHDWLLRMRPRGGGAFDGSATVVCGLEPTQHLPELQWLMSDITTRRREALALQQANAELEARVAERTRELEAASRAKDDFLASLSHELRTPVNVIRGFARMLRDGSLQADAAERAIEAIDRNAARQTRLVSDLLDVSRITSGKFSIQRQQIDLCATLTAASESAAGFAAERQVALQIHMPDTPALMMGDGERLQQVFDNLLSNAIKFTPAGGAVHADIEPDAARWRIIVRDTGIGITPEFMPHLFQRFRQADSGTSIHGGLGLGLSIVHHIIACHGGMVTAQSEGRGKGATFTCVLPALWSGHRALEENATLARRLARRAADPMLDEPTDE